MLIFAMRRATEINKAASSPLVLDESEGAIAAAQDTGSGQRRIKPTLSYNCLWQFACATSR
eukprot:722581-Alexandrium_andersonii.AAC.1